MNPTPNPMFAKFDQALGKTTPTTTAPPVQSRADEIRALAKTTAPQTSATTSTETPQGDSLYGKIIDNPVTRGIQNIFPGKQIGQAIGTLGGYGVTAAKEALGYAPKGSTAAYDTSAPSPLQVAADLGQGALTVAAPEFGKGASVLGRIGENALLGAGIGATGATAEGKGAGDIAKETAIGGTVGGVTSAVGEGVKKLTENLPKWLTKLALPKLDNKNIDYSIQNTGVGSLKSLQTKSNGAIKTYEDSVQSVLNHPEYKGQLSYTPASMIGEVLNKFPNSEYTPNDIVKNAQDIAPTVGKLITKFEQGTADIKEINAVRKELDKATQSVYTSLNRPPEKKLLGAAFANILRDYVKTTAPETEPIFAKYTQEVGLNKALSAAVKKGEQKIKLGDIAAGVGGFAHSGLTGALEAILAERLLLNPAAQLGGAKLLTGAAKYATPVAETAFQVGKAPALKAVSSFQSK